MPSRLATTFFALLALLTATTLAQDKTPGCGKEITFSGQNRNFNITSSGKQRSFVVYIPQSYDANTPGQTMLGFHGATGIGLFFQADTRLNGYSVGDSGQYIMVYPDGVDGFWASGIEGLVGNRTVSVEEDLSFITDLLDYLRENFCIDNQKIYASGISNGGGIINRVACDPVVGRNFAAFAPVAGAYTGFQAGGNATCEPYKSPIPIISIHGGNDTTVPYVGRNGTVPTPPIREWLDEWAIRNRCGDPVEETINGTVHKFTWDCDGVPGAMVHYLEDDMGHYWPSQKSTFSQSFAGAGPTKLEGNEVIIEFFSRFDLNTTGEVGEPPNATETGSPNPTETGGEEPTGSNTNAPGAASALTNNLGVLMLAMGVAIAGCL